MLLGGSDSDSEQLTSKRELVETRTDKASNYTHAAAATAAAAYSPGSWESPEIF